MHGLYGLENTVKTKHVKLTCFAVKLSFDAEIGVTLIFRANNLLSC